MDSAAAPTSSRISASEVLVALALVLVLVLLFSPKIWRSRLAANEAAAVATIKSISHAELTYAATYPAIGFAERIDELGGQVPDCVSHPDRACLLETAIADPPHTSRGYLFSAEGSGTTTRTSFFSLAIPVRIGETGQLTFCTTNRWVIHYRGDLQQINEAEICEAAPVLH